MDDATEPAPVAEPEAQPHHGEGSSDPLPLLEVAGVDLPADAEVQLIGADPVLAARHRPGDASAAAIAAAAAWAGRFGELRGLPPQRVTVEVAAAAASLLGFVHQAAPGATGLARTFSPVTDLFPTRDGRHIHLHGGFPHLAAGAARLLGCEATKEDLTRAVARWDAADLEDALAEVGLCGAMVRSASEWAEHAHGRRVAHRPAIELTRIADGEAEAPSFGRRPLEGIRVLDHTRVLAGPTVGRTLAAHGAEVVRIDSPHLPSIESFDVDTGRGKRRAHCDLDDPDDVAALHAMLDTADVVVQGYRPGALEARGFGPSDLAARRPGIVVVQVSCYGSDGPWAGRRGWEQLAQATSGVAMGEAEAAEAPRLIPAAATDYTTGYLGAAGAAAALVQRAQHGGSWLVEVSLCATAGWLVRLGATCDPAEATGVGDVAARQQQTPTAWGLLTHLAPVERLSVTPARWDLPPCPAGSHPLRWATAP